MLTVLSMLRVKQFALQLASVSIQFLYFLSICYAFEVVSRSGADPWDPSFTREALALNIATSATQQAVPLGTQGAPVKRNKFLESERL